MHCRYNANAQAKRDAHTQAFAAWARDLCAGDGLRASCELARWFASPFLLAHYQTT